MATPSNFDQIMAELKADKPHAIELSKQLANDFKALLDMLPAEWPKGLTRYPTKATLDVLVVLSQITSVVRSQIIEMLNTDVVLFNLEALQRVERGLDTAEARLKLDMDALTDNVKANRTDTILRTSFRDDVIRWMIEIDSALFVLPEIADNVPNAFFTILAGIFIIAGTAMVPFIKTSIKTMIDGAIALINLAANAAKAALKLVPDQILIGMGILFGGFVAWEIYKR